MKVLGEYVLVFIKIIIVWSNTLNRMMVGGYDRTFGKKMQFLKLESVSFEISLVDLYKRHLFYKFKVKLKALCGYAINNKKAVSSL
jgi:hypothetical protein